MSKAAGTGTGDRRRRERRGRGAEALAALLLTIKGYRIVARRVRTPAGEIDLIARRRGVVAFVEVKARRTEAEAAQSISRRQRARIVRAATHFLAGRPDLAAGTARFDAVLVARGRLPRHIISAWTESAD